MTTFAATLPYPRLAPTTVALDGSVLRVGSLCADCVKEDLAVDLYGYPSFPPIGTVVRVGSLAIAGRDLILPDALAPAARIVKDVAVFLERDAFLALIAAVADARHAAFLERTKGYRDEPPREDPARWQPIVATRFPLASPDGVFPQAVAYLVAPLAAPLAYVAYALTASGAVGAAVGLATMLGAIACVAKIGFKARGKAGERLFLETLQLDRGDLVHRRGTTETRRPLGELKIELRNSYMAGAPLRYAAISIEGLGPRALLVGVSDTRFAWAKDAKDVDRLPLWVWPCMWVDLLRALDLEAQLELRPAQWTDSLIAGYRRLPFPGRTK